MNKKLCYLNQESFDASWGRAGFIDVETTGLNPYNAEVVELAVSLFAFRKENGHIMGILDEYVGLREPTRPIPPQATNIHGITNELVRGKVLNYTKIESLICQADFLVAHNAIFDKSFVDRLIQGSRSKPWLCSMNGIEWKKRGFPSKGLQNLLRSHGICLGRAHRGEYDVKASLLLLSQHSQNGKTYFFEMLKNYGFTTY